MAKREITSWTLTYTHWDAEQQSLREALCALGNGYFVTRGAFEEVHAGGPHYPGTYLAGGYNRLKTDIAGHVLESEDLVNWPNWLPLNFRPAGGDWFDLNAVDLLDFQYCLDVYRGILERRVHFRDADDREFTLISRRFVHMQSPHLAAIEWRLTAHNWSGEIEIRSALDGTVTNQNVDRYRQLNGNHLEVLDTQRVGEDIIALTVDTNQSHIRMGQAARSRVYAGDTLVATQRQRAASEGRISQTLVVPCQQHQELRIEKVVALYSSRDFAISEPGIEACKAVRRAGTFDQLLAAHALKWQHLWSVADIALQDHEDPESQFILRLHIFHLLQTTSPNTIDRDVGVPSRGWHGEAYRGHILWDELFIFPFITLRMPELARSLLMYRYRRLDEARWLAKQEGYSGAMFPWQSGSDGREESQVLHLNPRSGRWIPDNSNQQRHVSAAIAYNFWQYYQVTNDTEFLAYYGAEIILEIARFWASLAIYSGDRDRYEIRGVMGPDEFHTRYPDTDQPGLNNNAYTNVMVVWVLRCACHILEELDEKRRQELRGRLDIEDEELLHWDRVSRRMFIPFHDDVISQFEGYGDLKEFDWTGYREKYEDIHRLDRILEAEGKDVNAYKASKQADLLMLFYLFSAEELKTLFEHMGYAFDPDGIPRTIRYYLDRTSHGSTLSRVVHSWVLARCDREAAWQLFDEALHSDIEDIQGGTTPEGIHLGAMAGTVDLIQRMHTGLEVRDNVLWFNPMLPKELTGIRVRIRYRGHWLSLQLNHKQLAVSFDRGGAPPVHIGFGNQVHEMCQGETREFSL